MRFIAATDGSNLKGERFGWAWVLATEDGTIIGSGYGSQVIDDSWKHAWNVAAECTAVIDLLSRIKPEIEVEIIHDYEGLGKWARGEWGANKPCSRGYISELTRLGRNVKFTWVKGHSGHEMNELVDQLAGKALREQPEIPVIEKRKSIAA